MDHPDHASGDNCRLLITFANGLGPDQDRQSGSKLFDNDFSGKKIYIKKVDVVVAVILLS